MKISILGCDEHGKADPRQAKDVLIIKGALTRRVRRIAVCEECDKKYWSAPKAKAKGNKPKDARFQPGEGANRLLKILAKINAPAHRTEIIKAAPTWSKGKITWSLKLLKQQGLVSKLGDRSNARWVVTTKGREAA